MSLPVWTRRNGHYKVIFLSCDHHFELSMIKWASSYNFSWTIIIDWISIQIVLIFSSVNNRGGRKIDPSMHRDSLSNDSGSILRISKSILRLVFNQMWDDAEFALETHVFCLLPIPHTHTPLELSIKQSFIKFRKVEANYKDIHGLHCAGCAERDERFVWRYTWSVRSRPSVFTLQMLYEVIIYVVWNAVDLYI